MTLLAGPSEPGGGRGGGAMAPHFSTRMKILKNRRNSSKLPRKLHGLKHINKTYKMHPIAPFKDEIIIFFYCGRGHPSHTLPSLCTETLGFSHSRHYKPSYSSFKKRYYNRYYNHRYSRPPPYVLGLILDGPTPSSGGFSGCARGAPLISAIILKKIPANYFVPNCQENTYLTCSQNVNLFWEGAPRPPTSGFVSSAVGLTWCVPPPP